MRFCVLPVSRPLPSVQSGILSSFTLTSPFPFHPSDGISWRGTLRSVLQVNGETGSALSHCKRNGPWDWIPLIYCGTLPLLRYILGSTEDQLRPAVYSFHLGQGTDWVPQIACKTSAHWFLPLFVSFHFLPHGNTSWAPLSLYWLY